MKAMRYVACLAIAAMVALMSSCGGKDAGLSKAVEEINKQVENQKMPGIEKMSLDFDDDYVIYNYVIDEEAVDMADLKENLDATKEQLSSSVINNPGNHKFTELVKKTGRGYKIVYKGNNSGEEAVITYSNEEL
ncbi:MAG: hypothetical protein K2G30_07205 [Muribaculaceae bacterium]|nr:hypothetical protein [Muribaculaceae bacterium]MDE7142057.1 hypothetical protein [Muribaculaceae bacterium]